MMYASWTKFVKERGTEREREGESKVLLKCSSCLWVLPVKLSVNLINTKIEKGFVQKKYKVLGWGVWSLNYYKYIYMYELLKFSAPVSCFASSLTTSTYYCLLSICIALLCITSDHCAAAEANPKRPPL